MKRDRSKNKGNDERYDQDSELYVGPSSRPFNISIVAQSPYLTQYPAQADFTHNLSPSLLSKLALRCSTKSIQDEVRRVFEEGEIREAFRKRMLAWGEEDEVEVTSERLRKKSKRGQSKEAEKEALEKIDREVPDTLKITTRSHLSAFYHREGLLEQSCIKGSVQSRFLQTLKSSTTQGQVGSGSVGIDQDNSINNAKGGSTSHPLVLSISVYARSVRNMWAKERMQQLAKKGAPLMQEAESDTSSASSRESEEGKIKKERSLYGPLQLVQKMEMLSNSTLQELRMLFSCRMDHLPERIPGEESSLRYSGKERSTDSCLLIEDILYSEKPGEEGYATLLERSIPAKVSPCKMQDVQLDSLSLCTGKLYWFLHQGSCEHLWTITSIRAMKENEKTKELFPLTNFYASAAAVHPLAKWTQSKTGGVRLSYTLDKCELCKGNQATMLIVGGSQFQSNSNISGLKQDTTSVCQNCWSALCGNKPLSIAELMIPNHHLSIIESHAASGTQQGNWTLVPTFE